MTSFHNRLNKVSNTQPSPNNVNLMFKREISLISEMEYTDSATDPDFMFEEIERLDEKLLNKYEAGIDLNKDYILNFWDKMEALDVTKNFDIRFDKDFAKVWTAKNGCPHLPVEK